MAENDLSTTHEFPADASTYHHVTANVSATQLKIYMDELNAGSGGSSYSIMVCE